jgi:hypothetical protein
MENGDCHLFRGSNSQHTSTTWSEKGWLSPIFAPRTNATAPAHAR